MAPFHSTPTGREIVLTVLYPSQEVRDIVIKSGIEHGAAESYDKLAELLAEPDRSSSHGR